MYTSVLAIALSGCFAPAASLPAASSWFTDYASAWQKGHTDKKPMVLVFGAGADGWQKLSKEGDLGKEAKHLLESDYVAVYVDTSKDVGSQLASSYRIAGGMGIVISDRTGDLQAFRHEGDLANADLERYLRKYSNADRVVTVTDTNPGPEYSTSNYTPVQASMPYQQSMQFQPGMMPSYQPSMMPSYQPMYRSYRSSGGCPNCR